MAAQTSDASRSMISRAWVRGDTFPARVGQCDEHHADRSSIMQQTWEVGQANAYMLCRGYSDQHTVLRLHADLRSVDITAEVSLLHVMMSDGRPSD